MYKKSRESQVRPRRRYFGSQFRENRTANYILLRTFTFRKVFHNSQHARGRDAAQLRQEEQQLQPLPAQEAAGERHARRGSAKDRDQR